MAFYSIQFAVFFTLFFFLYWRILNRSLTIQNLLLLIGSYIFYAVWDWRFLGLLIGISLVNYLLGIYIYKAENVKIKRLLLTAGVLFGVGLLIFFKYFNFFIDSFVHLASAFKFNLNYHGFRIILPLGISFYTFRTLSYLLDVEKGKIRPVTDWVVFFCYVAFFPSLISGPIDRARYLVPQLEKKRTFDFNAAVDGMNQFIWGLFKKLVVADNCAGLTNQVFDNYKTLPASSLVFGAFCFTIQVYADFSGYSDMAIGLARLLGFNITRNFDFPFFSQNIAEYWRKWHISLTTWMTDYIFMPLNIAFRNYGTMGMIFAILINFTVIGIWHGANWTFVLFGLINGCLYIPLILRGTMNKTKKIRVDKWLPSPKELLNILGTFALVMLTDILFRSDSIHQAFDFWYRLLSPSLFSVPVILGELKPLRTFFFIFVLLLVEWVQRGKQHGLQLDPASPVLFRFGIYYVMIFAMIFYSVSQDNQFIYFKF